MKKFLLILSVSVFLSSILFLGCQNPANSDPVAVSGIVLEKGSIDLPVGISEQLIVDLNPTNATNKNVTWTSSNSTVASVDSTGLVTGLMDGTSTITQQEMSPVKPGRFSFTNSLHGVSVRFH